MRQQMYLNLQIVFQFAIISFAKQTYLSYHLPQANLSLLFPFAKQTYLLYHLPQANLYLFSFARKRGTLAFDYSAAEEDIVGVKDGGLAGGGGADGDGGLDEISAIAERADHRFDVGGVVADADEAG